MTGMKKIFKLNEVRRLVEQEQLPDNSPLRQFFEHVLNEAEPPKISKDFSSIDPGTPDDADLVPDEDGYATPPTIGPEDDPTETGLDDPGDPPGGFTFDFKTPGAGYQGPAGPPEPDFGAPDAGPMGGPGAGGHPQPPQGGPGHGMQPPPGMPVPPPPNPGESFEDWMQRVAGQRPPPGMFPPPEGEG
jgi:hypothetical protein